MLRLIAFFVTVLLTVLLAGFAASTFSAWGAGPAVFATFLVVGSLAPVPFRILAS